MEMEWKWNGNGMEMEWKWNGNGMEGMEILIAVWLRYSGGFGIFGWSFFFWRFHFFWR